MMEEKLRGFNLEAAKAWAMEHPNTPIPPQVWQTGEQGVQERNADQLVSGNAEAESEVHAAINPADSANLIVAGIVQDPTNFTAPLNIPVRYTKDFGQTWATSSIDFNGNASALAFTAGGGDPVIAFDKSGNAYLSWLVLTLDFLADPPVTLALYASKSTNKGQTWSTPTLIDKGEVDASVLAGGAGTGDLVDKQWMVVDQTSGPNEGNLYVSYTRFEIIDSVTSTAQILFKKKPKNSTAFSANPVQVNTNDYGIVQFSSIVVDEAGAIHVAFFGGNSASSMALYHSVSTDGGATFSAENKISNVYFPRLVGLDSNDTIPGISKDRLYPCPHLAVGKTPGTLYCTWTSNGLINALTSGFDVWFTKSVNGGANWGTAKKINAGSDPAAHQFYSSIFVNSAGTVCLSYYDRTDDPTGLNTDYVLATSTNEGLTFSTAVKASSTPSDFGQIGALNAGFGIGEYTQVVATPHFAIPVWADGRTNDGNIELYAAFIPISGASGTYEWGSITDALEVKVPNPTKQAISLMIDLKKASTLNIQIFDMQGKLIHSEAQQTIQPAGSLQRRYPVVAGTYACKVETAFGAVVRKVVVE
jgi:hypothetical protein